MPVITMPDGVPVEFPDDMPKEKIQSLIATKFPKETAAPKTFGQSAKEMVTDIPSEIGREYSGAYQTLQEFGKYARGTTPIEGTGEEPEQKPEPKSWAEEMWEGMKQTAGAAGAAAYLGTGIGPAVMGTAKSVIGHGAEALGADYETAKTGVDIGSMALGGVSAARHFRPKVPIEPKPQAGPFGIDTPKGPIPSRLTEGAKERVGETVTEQERQVGQATERIQRGFDPAGQIHARTRDEFSQIAEQELRDVDALAERNVDKAYATSERIPAGVDVRAVAGIDRRIKDKVLSTGLPAPVLDNLEKMSPEVHALAWIDRSLALIIDRDKANAPAFAKSVGAPPNWVGINLKGFNEIRKQLNHYYKQAFGAAKRSGDYSSVTGMKAIISAFDGEVERLMKSPAARGDPRALQAWLDARALSHEYQKTFKSSGTGSVSDVVSKIVGNNPHSEKVPHDLATYAFGSNEVNPKRFNVAVMKEMKSLLGADSDGWIGGKQSLFAKIMTPVQGEFKPQKSAQRIRQFLTEGRQMAEVMYSPSERRMLTHFADVLDLLEITKTAPEQPGAMGAMGKKVIDGLTHLVGGALGHTIGVVPGMKTVGKIAAGGVRAGFGALKKVGLEERQIEEINKQLPILRNEIAKWQQATDKAMKTNTTRDRQLSYTARLALTQTLRKMGVSDITGTPQQAQQPQKQDKLGFQGPMQ